MKLTIGVTACFSVAVFVQSMMARRVADVKSVELGYSTREVAKLVELPERRIRSYARAGLVGQGDLHLPKDASPRRTLRFNFRDLLVLRMAAKLLAQGLPAGRIQRALAALQRQAEAENMPLSGTRLFNVDGRVVASDGTITWHPESGQCLLRFGARRMAEGRPTPLNRLAEAASTVLGDAGVNGGQDPAGMANADTWFDRALELEETDPQGAYELYLRALAADPEHVEATINIGRICSANGDARRAAAYFRRAAHIDTAHPVAHFNLAVTLHDLNDLPGAAESYRVALLHDPHFADAHYNLATLLEKLGEKEEALRHFRAYRAVRREPSS